MYAHAEEVARLCVDQARGTLPTDDTLHVMDTEPEQEDAPSIAEVATAVGGRVIETAGILQDDDSKIAEGKTIAARAIDD